MLHEFRQLFKIYIYFVFLITLKCYEHQVKKTPVIHIKAHDFVNIHITCACKL